MKEEDVANDGIGSVECGPAKEHVYDALSYCFGCINEGISNYPCMYCGKTVFNKVHLSASSASDSDLELLPVGKEAHYECYHRALIRDELSKVMGLK